MNSSLPTTMRDALLAHKVSPRGDGDAIERAFEQAISQAHTTWGAIQLDEDIFARKIASILAERLASSATTEEIIKDFESLHMDDLYLATAALARAPDAILTFQRRYAPEIGSVASRFDSHRLTRDDLTQSLHALLLVGNPPKVAPKLERYTGTGPLYSWLRVTASRHFIDLTRSPTYSPPDVPLVDELLTVLVDHGDDLETQFLKDTYRSQFKRAVAHAVDELDAEQRILLRQSFIERQSIDALSQVHGVHRATVARRIQRARDELFALSRKSMMQELQLEEAQFTSIFNLIQSRLDVSIQRLLTQKEPAS